MSDLSDLSDLSDICAAEISRVGKKRAQSVPVGKISRRTAIPARYDSFSAAPTNLSGMTGCTKLARHCRDGKKRAINTGKIR